ncbi:type IV pilus modification protein PilV [Cellvibrio polysaccharolyticus]|nr:type IV pilus modification protein PilV [Cellvibrio polysaccharolyticus]
MVFNNKQAGVGLLEVLIAVLILSVSLLAIASLQSRSLQYNQSAYVRSQVNILAYDIFDRIRSNRPDIASYALSFGDEAPSGGGIANTDMKTWMESMQRVLPEAEAELACTPVESDKLHKCKVSIRWTENNIFDEQDEDALDAEARSTLTYTTSI